MPSSKPQPHAAGAGAPIRRPSPETSLLDLADRVATALANAPSKQLRCWAGRLRVILAGQSSQNVKIGAIHANARADQGPAVASKDEAPNNVSIAHVSASAMDASSDMFADWLYSCDRVVIVVDSRNLVGTLSASASLRASLSHHPDCTLCIDGLHAGKEPLPLFTDILTDALRHLGMLSPTSFESNPLKVVSASSIQSIYSAPLGKHARAQLLAGALQAAITSAERGGVRESRSVSSLSSHPSKAQQPPQCVTGLMQTAAPPDSYADVLSLLSLSRQRIQTDFESCDLQAVDASIGSIKQRTRQWFSSGRIWQSLFLRVYETADDLIDRAILHRSLEAAELGMVHAAGRLNENIRSTAACVATRLDALSSQPAESTTYADSPAIGCAIRDLHMLACNHNAVDKFTLAKHVWAARSGMTDSNVLETIPAQIHIALVQFWAIQASAAVGAVASSIYLDMPLQYAAGGWLAVFLLAFAWLARRWHLLESSLYRWLDSLASELKHELTAAHRQEIESKLVVPVSRHIPCVNKHTPSATSLPPADGHIRESLSKWKTQLELAKASITK
ncbi:hypothetical protein GGI07_005822 [Coemansia sp. Benny D115]|nr:hypothetical protein GGI07_005822 [Coemansia sp. Benny D115]